MYTKYILVINRVLIGVIVIKNNGLIECFSNNERKTIEINYKNLDYYFYDYTSDKWGLYIGII